MNIKNKKNLIIFAVIFLLQLLYAPNLKAQEVNEIYEEELPATDPFIGGVTIATTPDSDTETNSLGISIMQNMRLVGTISGAHKKIAVLAMPDGRVIKYEENDFIADDIQLIEIYTDLIVVLDNVNDQYEVYMNSQIRPREGN